MTSAHGQFPNNDTFQDGLDEDQLVLLEYFKRTVEKTLGAKRLVANSLHPSIGVPIRNQSEPGKNVNVKTTTRLGSNE